MAAALRPSVLLPCSIGSAREAASPCQDVSGVSHGVHALPLGSHESSRGCGPLLPRSNAWVPALQLSGRGGSRGVLARAEGEVARPGGDAWGLLGSPPTSGGLTPLASLLGSPPTSGGLTPLASVSAASALGPLRASRRNGEQRRGKALGPLLAHHTLRAASSFHFLAGGLADVAALGFRSPLDASIQSRSVHDVRAEQPGPSFSVASEPEASPAEEGSDSRCASPTPTSLSLSLSAWGGACRPSHVSLSLFLCGHGEGLVGPPASGVGTYRTTTPTVKKGLSCPWRWSSPARLHCSGRKRLLEVGFSWCHLHREALRPAGGRVHLQSCSLGRCGRPCGLCGPCGRLCGLAWRPLLVCRACLCSASESAGTASSLKLVSGACALPHPDKAEKGGEDAFFISSSHQAIGKPLCALTPSSSAHSTELLVSPCVLVAC